MDKLTLYKEFITEKEAKEQSHQAKPTVDFRSLAERYFLFNILDWKNSVFLKMSTMNLKSKTEIKQTC